MTATLKQRAYNHIRGQLIAGRLSPGARLCNRTLAKEIGVSLIPVREAISQLVSEGLAEHRPKMGAFVLDVGREELEELYDLREALECHAAAKAVGRLTQAELAEMDDCNAELAGIRRELLQGDGRHWTVEQIDRWMMADAGLHMTLLRAAGNRRSLKTVSDLRLMTHIFGRRWEIRPVDDLDEICRQHEQIVAALRRGDAAGAADVMREHLRRGCRLALAQFGRRRMDEAAGQAAAGPARLQDRLHAMERTFSGKEWKEQ